MLRNHLIQTRAYCWYVLRTPSRTFVFTADVITSRTRCSEMNYSASQCEKHPQTPQKDPASGLDSTIPTKAIHNPVVKNIGNTGSRKLAISAMCAHCMGCTEGHLESGFREEIRMCSAQKCPLWLFRPFQSAQGNKQGGSA